MQRVFLYEKKGGLLFRLVRGGRDESRIKEIHLLWTFFLLRKLMTSFHEFMIDRLESVGLKFVPCRTLDSV